MAAVVGRGPQLRQPTDFNLFEILLEPHSGDGVFEVPTKHLVVVEHAHGFGLRFDSFRTLDNSPMSFP